MGDGLGGDVIKMLSHNLEVLTYLMKENIDIYATINE